MADATPTVPVTPKPFWKSKTFWFGVLQIAASGGALLSGAFPPSAPIAGAVSGIATIILRAVTTSPVTVTQP